MQVSNDIALRVLTAENGEPRSEVIITGRATGSIVTGCVLEAALCCARGWLLFVTDDVPYEELLSIHLLDEQGRLRDTARIGGPYVTGSFKEMNVTSPSSVHFRFIDQANWSVEVLDRPRRTLPWWPDARGVSRDARWLRHFQVHRTDRAASE